MTAWTALTPRPRIWLADAYHHGLAVKRNATRRHIGSEANSDARARTRRAPLREKRHQSLLLRNSNPRPKYEVEQPRTDNTQAHEGQQKVHVIGHN